MDNDNADTISIDTLALEEIVQEERAREISELNSLSKKVCYLHTSLLYYRNPRTEKGKACYETWKTLLKKIGGTPNSWRDLGFLLGVKQDELDYIMNSMNEDPTDVVLRMFQQNDNATLDKVLDALVKMNRYDILKSLEEPLSNLTQCFSKNDSGYHSNEKKSGEREIISYTKNLHNNLPPALNKNFVTDKDPNTPRQPVIKPLSNKEITPIKNDSPILFLTFVEDGLQTALNIQNYVKNWTEFEGITVISLNDRRQEVYQNPEKFIREYFEKADFVVPIISSGYLNEIKSHNASVLNTNDNLDFKYVRFIYNLIVNHYIHVTGCMNKKVRSVLPQNVDTNILRTVTMYPDLLPWTFETNFDEQFQAFLRLLEYS